MPTSPNAENDPCGLKVIAADIATKLISLGEDEESAVKYSTDVLERIVNATRAGIREGKIAANDEPLQSA